MSQDFFAETSKVTIAGKPVINLRRQGPAEGYQIIGVKIAEAAGAAPVEITVRKPDGTTFNLLGTSTPESIEERYQISVSDNDPYAKNEFFKPGIAAPLWPLANRLVGSMTRAGVLQAEVKEQKVSLPINNGLQTGQRPHHLHGLLFAHAPDQSEFRTTAGDATYEATFNSANIGDLWTGESQIRVMVSLKQDSFEFWIEARNVGTTPVPVGLGAHPYFLAPSEDSTSVRLWIPASKTVEIDNFDNVLPTGRINEVTPGTHLDFNRVGGVALSGRYLDNLWVNLQLDAEGFAFSEFIDNQAELRIRMTALTKNIIGIQCYAPKPETNPQLGVFAALELVTNLPDPREELWQDTPTGMTLLGPGEHMTYGYKLEILPFVG